MRLMLIVGLGAGFFLLGCSAPPKRTADISYMEYRSSNDLLVRRATIEMKTADFLKKGPPEKMTNKRKLGSLADEIALDQLAEKEQIEKELAKRYRAGDKKAYFEGIELIVLE